MSSLEVFGTNMDKFWQLCTRLERLDICVDRHVHVALPPGEYPNLKHLGVEGCYVRDVSFSTEFVQRFPHLTSISWRASPVPAFIFGLFKLLEAKALPNLEYLDTRTEEITIAFLPDLVLDIVSDTIESSLAQVPMSSCPLLEKLFAPPVGALVVTEGEPWVCLRLESLGLALCFDPPSTVSRLQPLILDRLSKLTQLEDLWMMGHEGHNNLGAKVDLRLENGLDKLSTLRLLRSLTLRDMIGRMGDAEVEWMLEHWKSLTFFSGALNTHNEAFNETLQERLKRGGIKVW
ncbi:MAG: hypothetical protein J3Q66DRAFT_424881 [Benniella sp.]|nr:MAG: hypothetical protein J3Q66DRAFT_424881 [Benniella sp.]